MGSGQKTCKSCGTTTGPRAFRCSQCNTSFNIQKGMARRNRGRAGEDVENWRELEKGDFIRAIAGSGPYWPCRDGDEPMGYHGLFRIRRVQRDGILCVAVCKRNSGFCFLYMGDTMKSRAGSILRSHKIRKVDSKFIVGKLG